MRTLGWIETVTVLAGGQLFTFVVVMIGLGIIAVPAGIMASTLGEARREETDADLVPDPAPSPAS